jgi:hypothetical protein
VQHGALPDHRRRRPRVSTEAAARPGGVRLTPPGPLGPEPPRASLVGAGRLFTCASRSTARRQARGLLETRPVVPLRTQGPAYASPRLFYTEKLSRFRAAALQARAERLWQRDDQNHASLVAHGQLLRAPPVFELAWALTDRWAGYRPPQSLISQPSCFGARRRAARGGARSIHPSGGRRGRGACRRAPRPRVVSSRPEAAIW